MKITKKQLRQIIKEEKARLLSEQAGTTEAMIIVDAIEFAVYDCIMDELKLKPEEMEAVKQSLLVNQMGGIQEAIENAFHDATNYRKKPGA